MRRLTSNQVIVGSSPIRRDDFQIANYLFIFVLIFKKLNLKSWNLDIELDNPDITLHPLRYFSLLIRSHPTLEFL